MSRRSAEAIVRASVIRARSHSGTPRWGLMHAEAWESGVPLAAMIRALATYADDHYRRYESSIGEDGVLGEEWIGTLRCVRGLLNGDLGRLDGGTLDRLLCDLAANEGLNLDG